MKREALKERMELLEIGEALGYPRLGYGRSSKIPHDKRIPAGKDGWDKFAAHAHVNRILPSLRIAKVLRDNGVMKYHPLSGAEAVHMGIVQDIAEAEVAKIDVAPGLDLLEEIAEQTTHVQPGTVAAYGPGKRRKHPTKKNKRKKVAAA